MLATKCGACSLAASMLERAGNFFWFGLLRFGSECFGMSGFTSGRACPGVPGIFKAPLGGIERPYPPLTARYEAVIGF